MLTGPAWTAALALAAGTGAAMVATAGVARLVAAAARERFAHAADPDAVARAGAAAGELPRAVVTIALPIAIAAALGALVGQGVIARGLWIPRRAVRGAPATGADPTTAGDRLAEATTGLVRGAILIVAAVAAVVVALPDLATLVVPDAAATATGLAAIAGRALATVAIAAVAASALELVVRARRLGRGLAMTERERRDDLRESHGDPALHRHQRDARDDDRAIVAGARVVIRGDALAVAIRWQAGDRPRPARIGRQLEARRLASAARQARVPIVADDALARALADSPGAVPDSALAALAAVLAAVGVRG